MTLFHQGPEPGVWELRSFPVSLGKQFTSGTGQGTEKPTDILSSSQSASDCLHRVTRVSC